VLLTVNVLVAAGSLRIPTSASYGVSSRAGWATASYALRSIVS
jgi:hypothetical protein